jgi:uncharacterized protein
MCVIDPSTAHKASAAAAFLFNAGFRYITLNINYGGNWTQDNLDTLVYEYEKMAEMYIQWTRQEYKFYLSPFELKIQSHIKGERYHADRREMAFNQPSVAPDGTVFPGSRYIDVPDFAIGDVFKGIDPQKQQHFFEEGANPPEPCKACALRTRCNYAYDSLLGVTSVQCTHEQALTPIADKTAETLYQEKNALFLHKHYNKNYSIISLLEDKI